MKNIFTFGALLASFASLSLGAQCVPDGSITTPGIYPPAGSFVDTTYVVLPDAYEGQFLDYLTQIRVLTDTVVDIGGFTINAPVDSLGIAGVFNIPNGLGYACDTPNCTWAGGENGCIRIFGTPTQAGQYNMQVDVKVVVNVPGFLDTVVVSPFQFVLEILPPQSIDESNSLGAVLFPNPSNGLFSLTGTSGERRYVELFDPSGRLLYSVVLEPGTPAERLGMEGLAPGSYVVRLRNGRGVARIPLLIEP